MLDVHEIVRHSPVGIAVIDRDGRYRSVNPAYAAMYGYEPADMPGLSFTVVFVEPERQAIPLTGFRWSSRGTGPKVARARKTSHGQS